jgi:hypothetical protein
MAVIPIIQNARKMDQANHPVAPTQARGPASGQLLRWHVSIRSVCVHAATGRRGGMTRSGHNYMYYTRSAIAHQTCFARWQIYDTTSTGYWWPSGLLECAVRPRPQAVSALSAQCAASARQKLAWHLAIDTPKIEDGYGTMHNPAILLADFEIQPPAGAGPSGLLRPRSPGKYL